MYNNVDSKFIKKYSKIYKPSKNSIRKYVLHGGKKDQIKKPNLLGEKKFNLNYNSVTEDKNVLSEFLCSSAIFSINSYIFDSMKNQKEIYNNLYKIYIFNSINNDQLTIDKILEICNTKFTINNIDLFDYVITNRSIYIYYQYLFIIILLEMTTGISKSNITTLYDRLNFFGEVMSHPLYTLNKFIRENIKFFSEKEKNIINSHLKLSSIFYGTPGTDKILKGGAEKTSFSKLIETVCEPRHDFGGSRSFAATHFRQDYDGTLLNENVPIPELNSLSKLLSNLKKNFYIYKEMLSTNINDYLKTTVLDSENSFETKLFNRFHTIKAVSSSDTDDFGYVGGLNYFSFDKDINLSSGEFNLSKWNVDGQLYEKKIDEFKEVFELFMKSSNITGYIYDTSSNMPGSSELLAHMKDALGIIKLVPIVNLWDPASASTDKFKEQLADSGSAYVIHNRTFMEDTNESLDHQFPRRNHLIDNMNLTYTVAYVEYDAAKDNKEKSIELTLKYLDKGKNVNVNLPIYLSEGLSVRLLSILINTFIEYLPSVSSGSEDKLKVLFKKEMNTAKKFERSKRDLKKGTTAQASAALKAAEKKSEIDFETTEAVYLLFVKYLKDTALFNNESAIKRIIQILLDFKKTGDWGLINWVDQYNALQGGSLVGRDWGRDAEERQTGGSVPDASASVSSATATKKGQVLLLTNDKLCALKSILIGNPTLFGWNENTFGFYQGKIRNMTKESVDNKIQTITIRYPNLFGDTTLKPYNSISGYLESLFSNIHKKTAVVNILDIFFGDNGYIRKFIVLVYEFKENFETVHQTYSTDVKELREKEFKKQVDKITLAFDVIESLNEFLGIDIIYIVKLISEIRNTIYNAVSRKLLSFPIEQTAISEYLMKHTTQLDEFLAKEHSSGTYPKRAIRSKGLIDQLYNDLCDKYTVNGKLDPGKLMLYDKLRNEGGSFAIDAVKDILSCINEIEIYKFCYQSIPQMYSSIITNLVFLDIGTENQHEIGTLLLHSFSTKSNESLEIHMPSNFLENNSKHTLEHISDSLDNVSNLVGCLLNRANIESGKNTNTEAKKVFLEYLDISKDFYTFIDEVIKVLDSSPDVPVKTDTSEDESHDLYRYAENCPDFNKVDAVERTKALLPITHINELETIFTGSPVEETGDSKSAEPSQTNDSKSTEQGVGETGDSKSAEPGQTNDSKSTEQGVGATYITPHERALINSIPDKASINLLRRTMTSLVNPAAAPEPSSSSNLRKTRTVTDYDSSSTTFTDFMVKFLFREIPDASPPKFKLPKVDSANYLTPKSMQEEPDFDTFHDLQHLNKFMKNSNKCNTVVILKKKIEDYKNKLYTLQEAKTQIDHILTNYPEQTKGLGYTKLRVKVLEETNSINKLDVEIKTIITEYNKGKEEKEKLGSLFDNGSVSDSIIKRLTQIENSSSEIDKFENDIFHVLNQDTKVKQLAVMNELLADYMSDDEQVASTSKI